MIARHQKEMSGVILSGGKNLRMGQNKAFIKIDGIPIIQRIVDLFQDLFLEIIIVTNQKELYLHFDAKVYTDLIPDGGALGGLYTGLFYSSFFYSFVVACDMPYLKRPVIDHLTQAAEGYDVILPKTQDGLEPLHAVYSRNCIKPILGLLKEGKTRISDVFPFVRVNVVGAHEILPLDPGMESFINLNTPDEVIRYQKRNIPHD
jgi:molybdopterin-guanine dinucleotide biosynthesis protein A